MKGLHSIWFALILLALLAALTLWIDRTVQPPAPKHDGSTRHDPDFIVSKFSAMRTDALGNPRHSLEGTELRHFPDDDSTDIDRPQFTQYSLKKPALHAQGERGQVSSNGENVYFMDNVKIVREATRSKGELTVLTEYLHIVPDQDFIQTDRPVTILQAPRTVIHANGMEFYKKQGILNLFNRIKVHYERPDAPFAPPLTIEKIAGIKAEPVAGVASPNRQLAKTRSRPVEQKQTANAAKVAAGNAKSTASKKIVANSASKSRAARKPEIKTEKTKTRIRRNYGNPAN
jgi:lipopolysaccharide export system protein LptC